MPDINYWAVLAAAVSSFLLGGLWYSPMLFGGIWNRENGSPAAAGHAPRIFAVSFVFALVAAALFAYWLGPEPPLQRALIAGVIAGAGIAATSFGINYQFANRSAKLWLIDGGYHTAQFVIFGLILGAWH